MILRVLRAEPSFTCLAWQAPPAVDEVLWAHMRNLAGPLACEKNQFERSPGYACLIEGLPEQPDLGIGQDPFAAGSLMAFDPAAGIDRDNFLPHRPGEDRRGAGEDLVGQHRRRDTAN